MPESLGMRRGIVIDNKDPKMMGRVKVFIPGVYPDEYAKAPEMLPWAEPAMGIFGGSWSNPAKGLNAETGVCSAPHAGVNGDGAQVWVFFEANDIRFPVYFAVAQSGKGWFANHNNQHVIKSDNVTVVVDEFDNHYEMSKKTKVPSETAAENFKGDPEELNKKIDGLGGASGLTEDLNGMKGSAGFSSLSKAFGGVDGIVEAAESMGGSLSSLSNFLDQTGGVDKLSSTIDAAGGSDAFFNALTGGGSATANSVIETSYGSKMNFIAATAQLGGVESLKQLAAKSGGLDKMCSSLSSANGSAGVGHLANMMNNLGSPQQFKDFFNKLTDGAKSLESIAASMASADALKKKQQEMTGELSDKEDPVTVCDSYTTKGNAAIKAGSKSSMKTRLAIRIEAAKNCAVDLHITGHVNLRIEGNVFREIVGNIYDTHVGDHYIYHKGSTFKEVDGRETTFMNNRMVKIKGNDTELIEGSATRSVAGLDSNYAEKKSTISTSEESVVLQNRSEFIKNLAETILSNRVISTLGDLSFVASNISMNAGLNINLTATDIVNMALSEWKAYSGQYSRIMSVGNVDVEGVGIPIVLPNKKPVETPENPADFNFLGPVNVAGGMLANPDISEFALTLVNNNLSSALEQLKKLQEMASNFSGIMPADFLQMAGVNLLSSTSVNSISSMTNNTITGGIINHVSGAGLINVSVTGSIVNFALDGSIANYTITGGIANMSGIGDLNFMLGKAWPLTLSVGCIVNTAGFAFDLAQLQAYSIINNSGISFDWSSMTVGSIVNNSMGKIEANAGTQMIIAAAQTTTITDQVAGIANIVDPAVVITAPANKDAIGSIEINPSSTRECEINAGTITADSGAYKSALTLKGLGVLTA